MMLGKQLRAPCAGAFHAPAPAAPPPAAVARRPHRRPRLACRAVAPPDQDQQQPYHPQQPYQPQQQQQQQQGHEEEEEEEEEEEDEQEGNYRSHGGYQYGNTYADAADASPQQQQQQQWQQHQHGGPRGGGGGFSPSSSSPPPQFRALQTSSGGRTPLKYASPWGAGGRRAALVARVRDAATVEALVSVWAANRQLLGPAELAVMFHQLGRVADPAKISLKQLEMSKALLRELLISSEDRMPSMAGPEFAYVIAALAKLRAGPDTAWLNRWMAVSRGKLEALTAEQLAVALRALCRLEIRPREVKECIAYPAWMSHYLAAIRPKLPQCGAFDASRLLDCLAELGHRPDREFMAAWCAAMQPKLGALDAGALARVMSSMAAVRHEPDAAFMRAYCSEVYQKLPLFDDRDLATALTAFTALKRLAKVDLLGEFLDEVAGKLPTFGPKALGNVLWALGELRHAPPPAWLDRVASHVGANVWRFHGRALSGAVWGLARCGFRPADAWVSNLLDASISKLRSLDAAGAVMMAQALAAWGYRPPAGGPGFAKWARWWEAFCMAVESRSFRGSQVCELLVASTSLGMPIDPQVLNALMLQLVAGGLNHVPVGALVAALAGLSVQGVALSGSFLNTVAQISRYLWSSLTPRETALVVSMLGAHGHAPRDQWSVDMVAQMHCSVQKYDAPSAAGALWGLAKMAAAGARRPGPKFTADLANRFLAASSPTSTPSGPSAAAGVGGAAAAPGAPAGAAAAAGPLARALWGAAALGFVPEEAWIEG